MGRTLRHLVLGLSLLVGGASFAGEILGPQIVLPDSAPTTPAQIPQSETKALGSPDRVPVKSNAKSTPAGAIKPAASNMLQGVVGPLAVVLLLIAMLAGLVVLVARLRTKLGGGAGLGASFGAGGRSPAGILEVLGRYPLASGLTLVLLKVDRRVLLLSQTRTGRFGGLSLSPICELDSPEDVASILLKVRDADSSSLTNRFASVFRSLDREAVDKMDSTDGKVMTTIAPATTLPRRSKAAAHRPAAEQTGSESVTSIRRRLDDLRLPSLRGGRGVKP